MAEMNFLSVNDLPKNDKKCNKNDEVVIIVNGVAKRLKTCDFISKYYVFGIEWSEGHPYIVDENGDAITNISVLRELMLSAPVLYKIPATEALDDETAVGDIYAYAAFTHDIGSKITVYINIRNKEIEVSVGENV